MRLRAMLRADPGFRLWVNRLLVLFWFGVGAIAVMGGWLGSRAFASALVICAASTTIWRVRTRDRGKPRDPTKQKNPRPEALGTADGS